MSKQAKPPTKAQTYTNLSEKAGVAKKDVVKVLDALEAVIGESLNKYGKFNLLGLMNLKVKHKLAVKAHQGINPFTKEPMMFKAKPAHKVVKASALKKLKDMV